MPEFSICWTQEEYALGKYNRQNSSQAVYVKGLGRNKELNFRADNRQMHLWHQSLSLRKPISSIEDAIASISCHA